MKNRKSEKILKFAKKIKAVNYLGGKCKMCGESNPLKLTFHHKNIDEKEFEFADYKGKRWSILENELNKCDLLCNNCHREIHYDYSKIESRRIDKSIYLDYYGGKCIKCGYNKCPSALSFHHKDSSIKSFSIGSLSERINSVQELSDIIKKEIEKCELLCMNCHVMEHVDLEFFEKNKEEIVLKSLNIKEIQPKINRNEVYEMYKRGIKQTDIAKYFNASNGTISDIIKKLKNGEIPKWL